MHQLASEVGPGDYDTRLDNGPAFTMGQKITDELNNKTPGPGQYGDSLVNTNKNGPAYTMARRHTCQTDDEQPAPGDYAFELCTRGPAFSLGTKLTTPQAKRSEPGTPSTTTTKRWQKQYEFF